MNVPCKDCITFVMCKNKFPLPAPNHAIGSFLTKLGHMCYMIKDYILLADLNIPMPPSDTEMKDNNSPFHRLKE